MNDVNMTAPTESETVTTAPATKKRVKKATKAAEPKKRPGNTIVPVIATTEYRGVFFGYAPLNVKGPIVKLQKARNCIYWDESVKGFVGLASIGPNEKCRIGPSANMTLRGVTCIIEVEPEARDNFEKAPWA